MRIIPYVAAWLMILAGVATAQTVGVTSAVNQSATGLSLSAKPKTIYIGEDIVHNEKITTDAKGLLQILLADGTSFTVGPNSSMSIDSFVYDPDAGSAKIVASLGKGVFRFIGGKSSKSPDGVELDTPVGTVGVRGGISNLDFSGATPFHVDMVYGDGVTLSDGTKIIGNVYHSGYSIVIGSDGKVKIQKTPPEWSTLFQSLMAGQVSGGTVTGTQVASTLSKTNKPNPGPNTGNNGPSVDTGVVTPMGPITTWAEIDNSSLAGVNARYDGQYSATLSVTSGSHSPVISSLEDDPFALIYSFATRDGIAYFGTGHSDPVHQLLSVKIPVLADDPTGPGVASFGNSYSIGNSRNGSSGTIDGLFLNTTGIADGVAGTFDSTTTTTLFGHTTTTDLNGAFAGDYSGAVTPR